MHIAIPNGNFAAWSEYMLAMCLCKYTGVVWSTSKWVALVLVILFNVFCGVPFLMEWKCKPTSMPVTCWIFLHSARRLDSGAEKSNHPRHIVVSASGICLCHIPCFVSVNHGPISLAR